MKYTDDYCRKTAERLGEMHTQFSEQYQKPVVVPCNMTDPDRIINHCRHMGAVYDEGDGVECFVVVLRPEVGPELYTELAIRKGFAGVKNGDR